MAVGRTGKDIPVDCRHKSQAFTVLILLGNDMSHKPGDFGIQYVIVSRARADPDIGRQYHLAHCIGMEAGTVKDSTALINLTGGFYDEIVSGLFDAQYFFF